MKSDNREEFKNELYLKRVSQLTPKTRHFTTCIRAFMVGGLICSIGEFIKDMLTLAGLGGTTLTGTVSIILIFLGSLLTGLGVYDRIGKFAGGGSIVPITGFANSVTSPAMEFKSEGHIFGLAAKMWQ